VQETPVTPVTSDTQDMPVAEKTQNVLPVVPVEKKGLSINEILQPQQEITSCFDYITDFIHKSRNHRAMDD
jgi:hypothetical protein